MVLICSGLLLVETKRAPFSQTAIKLGMDIISALIFHWSLAGSEATLSWALFTYTEGVTVLHS